MKRTLLPNLMLLDAALLLLLGLSLIFVPTRVELIFGFKDLPQGVSYILGLWGCMLATMGLGYVVAAGDPLRHVVWVQMGIARGALECLLGAVCLARGVVGIQQSGFGIAIAAFITIAYQRSNNNDPVAVGELVTTCPTRFFDGNEIFRWVSEVMLGTTNPLVIGEIPFLQKLKNETPEEGDEEPGGGDFIGRIDNILVHPDFAKGLNWCALEMQAVYFSGASMAWEFKDIEEHPEELRFPVRKRHPDFRSSGPKRLLPQLQTKVPELTTWGKKMAICVDETFFAELVGIEELKHLSNAHLAWFVVRYEAKDGCFRLRPKKVVFSKLESTVKALTGGTPLPQEIFEQQIRAKLGSDF